MSVSEIKRKYVLVELWIFEKKTNNLKLIMFQFMEHYA